MIEKLFTRNESVQEHRTAPLAESRLGFLNHSAAQGYSPDTLRRIATAQLAVVRHVSFGKTGKASLRQVEDAVDHWAALDPGRRSKPGTAARRQLIAKAVHWLEFAGRLQCPAAPPAEAHVQRVAEFADELRQQLGRSEATIRLYSGRLRELFRGLQGEQRDPDDVGVADIDRLLARKGPASGLSRCTQRSYGNALRAYFRFAEQRGWCAPGLAEAVTSPRIHQDERLPSGPAPDEVRSLLATAAGDRAGDLRDRAILLLLSVYGLRAGEVAGLRLDDIDWNTETLCVRRPKTGRVDRYPLARSVGAAIIRYLRAATPRCGDRAIFLTVHAPIRPLSSVGISALVIRRMRRIGVESKRRGAHCLRHARAQRLLDDGLSLHEIGDYLGHRSLDSTAVYAKVGNAAFQTMPRLCPRPLETLLFCSRMSA